MAVTLWAMRGYSGSGKSTRAEEIAKQTGAVIVNRDQLRKMLLGKWWTGLKEDEDRVTTAEEAQVTALLKSGVSVALDSTHLHPPYLRKWARLATRMGVEFEVVDMVTDPDECKRRDHTRMLEGGRYVGDKVIDQQARRHPAAKWPRVTAEPFVVEPVERVDGLPCAIICDIDGTLAAIPEGGRSPYDYSRVGEDVVDPIIRSIVNREHAHAREIIIMSGRDDTCRVDTHRWLQRNYVNYDQLLMRPASFRDANGGKAPDYMVKYHLFNEHVRGKFNVLYILDDRQQVVDLWRSMGLKCLQVAAGDF